jgi:hypothetical protein
VGCVLYGREGYHALFLKPLAELLGCRYVALEYLELYEAFLKGGGVFYVEEPWLWSRPTHAPPPPFSLPKWAEWMRGRMYPLLGNLHLFFTDGRYNSASETPCGRVGLLAKRGEPLVTDLFLPLFLETGDVAKALRTAKALFRCGLPKSRDELIEGVKSGRYVAGYIWSAWTPGLEVELRPYPALGKAVSGFWGLVELDREVPAYAYPPPYLEVAGPYRRFLENAVSIRGPGWMDFVLRSHGPLERFLFGEVGEEAAARRLGEIAMVLQS